MKPAHASYALMASLALINGSPLVFMGVPALKATYAAAVNQQAIVSPVVSEQNLAKGVGGMGLGILLALGTLGAMRPRKTAFEPG